jgi:hypothetical protein
MGGFIMRTCVVVCCVEIQPRRDNTCRLMNPWPGKPVVVREGGRAEPVPVELDRSNGQCLVFSAIAGRKYTVEAR